MRHVLASAGLVLGLLVLPVSLLWCPWHTEFLAIGAAAVVIPAGLLLYRRDFARFGRARLAGVVGSLGAFLGPMLVLGAAGPIFPPAANARMVLGYVVAGLGIGLSLAAATWFRAVPCVFGIDPGHLAVTGPYRWSRNPQYVLAAGLPVGYALVLGTWAAWVGVGLYALVAHGLVRIEEEHLEAVFGEAYRRYRSATPRYLGRPRREEGGRAGVAGR